MDELAGGQAKGANQVYIQFFGTGADNATLSARITAWSRIGTLWIPTPLLALDVTLGGMTGEAGADIADTDRLADTIAVASGGEFTDAYEIISPESGAAGVKVDTFGAERIQVQLAVGTATGANAILRPF